MLRKKTFQNKVAASRYSLPITATLATLVWVAVGLLVSNIWVEFAFTAMSTLLMVELNNRNALMRTYSRMVSCSFLALMTMAGLPQLSLKSSGFRADRLFHAYTVDHDDGVYPLV